MPTALRLLAGLLLPIAAGATATAPPLQDDVDAFMQRVLERRLTNWEDLYRHTVRDREEVQVRGPGGEVLESQSAEHVWYVRDGEMVRSPWQVNGVRIGDEDRERSEQRWLDGVRKERARREERRREREAQGRPLERDYFLGFPFEPGNYYVAGFEQRHGHEVARIEYYPVKLFEGDETDEADKAEDEDDEEWVRRFQKTTLVTMWVLPEEHQIVEIRFENIGLEFLPARWLVQIDDVSATMVMERPFADEDVWLPRSISAHGKAAVATGAYEIDYTLEYFDYRQADVAARVRYRLPGQEQR